MFEPDTNPNAAVKPDGGTGSPPVEYTPVAPPDSSDGNTGQLPVQEPQAPSEHQVPSSIPYSRFQEVVAERNRLRDQIAQQPQPVPPVPFGVPPFMQSYQQPQYSQPYPVQPQYQQELTPQQMQDMVDNGTMCEAEMNAVLIRQELTRQREIDRAEQQRIQYEQAIAEQQMNQITQFVPELNDSTSPVYQQVIQYAKMNPMAYKNPDGSPNWGSIGMLAMHIRNSMAQPRLDANAYNNQRQAQVQSSAMPGTMNVSNPISNQYMMNSEQAMYAKRLGLDPNDQNLQKRFYEHNELRDRRR